jgi:hypothetical protein
LTQAGAKQQKIRSVEAVPEGQILIRVWSDYGLLSLGEKLKSN